MAELYDRVLFLQEPGVPRTLVSWVRQGAPQASDLLGAWRVQHVLRAAFCQREGAPIGLACVGCDVSNPYFAADTPPETLQRALLARLRGEASTQGLGELEAITGWQRASELADTHALVPLASALAELKQVPDWGTRPGFGAEQLGVLCETGRDLPALVKCVEAALGPAGQGATVYALPGRMLYALCDLLGVLGSVVHGLPVAWPEPDARGPASPILALERPEGRVHLPVCEALVDFWHDWQLGKGYAFEAWTTRFWQALAQAGSSAAS